MKIHHAMFGLILAPLVASAGEITLEIRHLMNGNPVSFADGRYMTAAGEEISITRLSYLVSQPALQREDGTWIEQSHWISFVDATKGDPRLKLTKLPRERFLALRFTFGVDPERNHSDPAQYPADHPLNPVLNNLHWDWQQGYIFVALEGHAEDEDTSSGFSYHIGNDPNLMTVTSGSAVDLTRNNVRLEIDFHLDKVLADGGFSILEATSTHSRPGDLVATSLKERIESAVNISGIYSVDPEAATQADRSRNSTPPLIGTPYELKIGRNFPVPTLPSDFPLTNERVELGETLFHDGILSVNGVVSCASCHLENHAFADERANSWGIDMTPTRRNSMPLFNLAWKSHFFWDGRSPSLREQVLEPIEHPGEMADTLENVVQKLSTDGDYPGMFEAAYGSRVIDAEKIAVSLEQYLLTLTSHDSKFDQALRGETELSAQEKRGFELFVTEYDPRRGLKGADCFHCHGGPLFTDHQLHNNGLARSDDLGLGEVTGRKTDYYKFSTPSLRNIAITAPYMHDSRFGTLEEVIDHYDSGIDHSPTLDPNIAKHPRAGLGLTAADKAALVAFLKALTDPQFLPPPH
ncbi:MAG: MbnP family protein [Verrucomicrobiota bacterium]